MTANTTPDPVMLSDDREWNETGKHHVMTCLWGQFKHQYQVLTITDTTWYQPGMWLSTKVMDQIVARKDWTVTMIHDNLLQNILSSVSGKLPGLTIPTSL